MDKISSLPDEVISHILSFLPTKNAALTSVLAKRWRILFAFSPNLALFEEEGGNRQSFMDFVDRLLAVSRKSPIKKFTISCREGPQPALLHLWICDVLNRGVLDLDIVGKNMYFLPYEVFSCKTIKKLKLSGSRIYIDNAFLPALEVIILTCVKFRDFNGCSFEKLLSASPVLKELVIYDLNWEKWTWSRTVTSSSLERLTIRRTNLYGTDSSDFGSISFDTPSVTHLNYYDYFPGSYPVVNLDSLVEANLDLVLRENPTNPTNLVKGLRNVKVMNLLAHGSLEMFYLSHEAIPVFKNLVHLLITTSFDICWRGLPFVGFDRCWRGLPLLLNKSPNLETLTIKGTLHHGPTDCECLSGYSFLLSCPVKVLKITEYMGTFGELEQLKHFLEKLSCLELLKVKICGKDKVQIKKELLVLSKVSTKCKIKVK